MYQITYETHFSASHRIRDYQGKCKDMHGHNWKIKVEVRTEHKNEIGLSMDFKDLKAVVNPVIDRFDHKYLNELDFLKGINPTAENIAEYMYYEIKSKLPKKVEMSKITVWETDKYSISYRE